ncbi:MAG TPA: hypothetical protein ENK34_09645 [Rhodobacteraceae bacterium]|nr:hypothetical protein [Paracoccaceae bacterium]
MDAGRIINMLLRMFMRKAVNKGIDMAARRGKPPAEMTAEERAQAQKAKQTAGKAQKLARLARRMGRF